VSKSGVIATPRYCQGSVPAETYQVRIAAMSSVMIPVIVPSGIDRAAERHSSAAWQVPSMPR
jgi:hypothetical protein